MAGLPSLLDVVVVIILLLPGFAVYSIARFIAVLERQLPEFETIIWSLFLSLGIYGVFAIVIGIASPDALRDNIFVPSVLFTLVATTLVAGLVLGLVLHVVVNKGVRPERGNPWDLFFASLTTDGRDLIVFTDDGKEFKGWVGNSGKDDRGLALSPTVSV